MASLDEYMIKMCDWQQQFNLPIAILPLFNALHQKMHGGSPNRLIRMMQCSTQKQKLIADVLFELTTVALKRCEPTTARNCIEMIQGCAEILKAAHDTLIVADHFLFMELPLEIRRRIYKQYIANILPWSRVDTVRPFKRGACDCTDYWIRRKDADLPNIDLCLTSSKIKDEFLAIWFESKKFYFQCSCELHHYLANEALRYNVRSILVHWRGKESANAFRRLQKITTLRLFAIYISDHTMEAKSEREQKMALRFGRNSDRIDDACGFDELAKAAQHVGFERISIHALELLQDNRDPSLVRNKALTLARYLKAECEAAKRNA